MKKEYSLPLKIYIKIRQFFQPYYNYIPKKKNKAKKDPDAYVGASYKAKNWKFMPDLGDLDVDDKHQQSDPKERKSVALSHKSNQDSQAIADQSSSTKQESPNKAQPETPQDVLTRTHYSKHNNKDPFTSLSGEKMGMKVLSVPKPLDKPLSLKTKPKPNTIWTYHDKKRHQTFGHYLPQSGFKYRARNNEERAKLKGWIKPRNRGQTHRTHLVPFGYHGSESDPRLVIFWDAEQNKNELNDFEQKAKAISRPIYWHADVRRTQYGAAWRYTVYDVETLQKLDTVTLKLDNTIFHWE